MKTDTRKYF